MTGFAVVLLFGSAFLFALWTLVESIRPQLHRYRALLAPAPAQMARPVSRITVRQTAPARCRAPRSSLREVA